LRADKSREALLPETRILRAAPEDAGELTRSTVAAIAHWRYPPEWRAHRAPALTLTPDNVRQAATFKARCGGQIAGDYSLLARGDAGWLDNLFVRPEFMGRGPGRALYEHALAECRGLGAARMEWESDPHTAGFDTRPGARHIRDRAGDFGRSLLVFSMTLDTPALKAAARRPKPSTAHTFLFMEVRPMHTTLALSSAQSELVARLAAAVHDINHPPDPLDVPPELLDLRRQILDRVDRDGLIVVSNFSGDPDPVMVYFMSLIGAPWRDEKAGAMVMDLKPVKHDMSVETTSYYSWNNFDYHTDLQYVDDPPDFIAVICVTPDANGEGRSIFADIRAAARDLSPDTLAELQKPNFIFKAPPHYRGGLVARKSILDKDARGEFRVRVRFDRATVEAPEAAAALEELSAAFDRHRIEFLVDKNQAYLIDNRRVVHGRTPFSPTFSDSDRHLKRILGMRSN
jgi:GNAT superfamily N-acetyltransferase